MSELITLKVDGPVATITMDDGKVNALSLSMLKAIEDALAHAERERKVVILRGRPGVFSAGFDLTVLRAGGDAARAMLHAGFTLAQRMLTFPAPVVIACTGHALAMGVFLVLSADYRIGIGGPFKLGANEAAIGLTIPQVAVEICRQRLAPAHFHRAVALAEIYAPEDAKNAGFLDEVVAQEAFDARTRAAAEALARLDLRAHAGCKLRARAPALEAMRAAMTADFAATM